MNKRKTQCKQLFSANLFLFGSPSKYLLLPFFYLLSSIFIFSASNFCWAKAAAPHRITSIKTVKKITDQKTHSSITLTYPVIKNTSIEINQIIQATLDAIVEDFKNERTDHLPIEPISGLPVTDYSNVLDVNYQLFNIDKNIISIRFSIYTDFYGAAHPLTVFKSVNYAVTHKKQLTLRDMFLTDDYLIFLSDHSKEALTTKLTKIAGTPTKPDPDGIKPTANNFAVWNITPKGLLLTFPPYQVAPYALGPQEILIPYAALKGKISF